MLHFSSFQPMVRVHSPVKRSVLNQPAIRFSADQPPSAIIPNASIKTRGWITDLGKAIAGNRPTEIQSLEAELTKTLQPGAGFVPKTKKEWKKENGYWAEDKIVGQLNRLAEIIQGNPEAFSPEFIKTVKQAGEYLEGELVQCNIELDENFFWVK